MVLASYFRDKFLIPQPEKYREQGRDQGARRQQPGGRNGTSGAWMPRPGMRTSGTHPQSTSKSLLEPGPFMVMVSKGTWKRQCPLAGRPAGHHRHPRQGQPPLPAQL